MEKSKNFWHKAQTTHYIIFDPVKNWGEKTSSLIGWTLFCENGLIQKCTKTQLEFGLACLKIVLVLT